MLHIVRKQILEIYKCLTRARKSQSLRLFMVIALISLPVGMSLTWLYASTTVSLTLSSSGAVVASRVSANPNYAYSLASNATSNYVLAQDNTILMATNNPKEAFDSAFNYANGKSLYVIGTFVGTFYMQYQVNTKVVFDPTSLLTPPDFANTYVFRMDYCQNCNVTGININGNGANQISQYYSGGILLYDCSNCTINKPDVTNCAGDGLELLDEGGWWTHHSPNSVLDGNFTYCLWNGLTIGAGGADYSRGTIVSGNEISHCANVGISTYNATNTVVKNNYVHDMDAISAGNEAGASCHWGIANEEGPYPSFINNTILNCEWGIVLPYGTTYVEGNNLTNCNTPIFIGAAGWGNNEGYNVITHNTVTNWAFNFTYQPAAIFSYQTTNDIVSFNTLTNNNPTSPLAIWAWQTQNSTFANNTITLNTATASEGIYLQTCTNNTIVSGNIIQARQGVIVGSGCINNKLNQNRFINCITPISDSGTGTIIDPTSSATYTLTFCNPYDGSSRGTYSFQPSTRLSISLTGGILNVDGSNVTTPYTLMMSQDHYVYALGGTATISEQK